MNIYTVFQVESAMCTIIVTIRSVLWAVMTIAGSLMILVALFTNRWLIGSSSTGLSTNAFSRSISDQLGYNDEVAYGIFLECVKPEGSLVQKIFH